MLTEFQSTQLAEYSGQLEAEATWSMTPYTRRVVESRKGPYIV